MSSQLQRAVYRTHFITPTLPPNDAEIGSLWSKTTTNELFICTAVSPLTFLLMGSTVSYSTVAEEGTSLTARNTLNFISANLTAADNAGDSRTDVTLTDTPQFTRIGLGKAVDANCAMAAEGQYFSETYANGNKSGAFTLDFAAGNVQSVTLTGNITPTLANPKDGSRYLLMLTQGGAGSFTVTWPTIRWVAGTTPTLTTTVGKTDIIGLTYVGGEYYGIASLNF